MLRNAQTCTVHYRGAFQRNAGRGRQAGCNFVVRRLFGVVSDGIGMVRPLSADAAEKSRSFCGIRGAACCRAPSMDSAGAYRTNQEGW
jgi:hypothetical protein